MNWTYLAFFLLLITILALQIVTVVQENQHSNNTQKQLVLQQNNIENQEKTLRTDITDIAEAIKIQLQQNGVLQSYSEHLGIDNKVLTLTKIGNPDTRDEWIALKASQTPPGSYVLDVSSGTRPYKHLFSHCHYFCHEFSGNLQVIDNFRGETMKTEPDDTYDFIGDITNTGAPSDTYDVVLLTEVLEHVPEPFLAIQELKRVAKSGAHIYVTAPFTSGSHQKPYHFVAGYSREWYQYAAEKYELSIIEIKSQGDYFKLLAQEWDRALSTAILTNASKKTVDTLRQDGINYMLNMSHQYGDGADFKGKHADDFTIGWMVDFVKP
jgi:SAM-dependent methyltransferase